MPELKDGPGGKITGSVSIATTATATMTVGASAELGNIIAKAKVEVSASLSNSTAITIGHYYEHAITSNKYGHMQYGAWGNDVGWRKEQDTPKCTTVVVASGTARIPSSTVGWRYWETAS